MAACAANQQTKAVSLSVMAKMASTPVNPHADCQVRRLVRVLVSEEEPREGVAAVVVANRVTARAVAFAVVVASWIFAVYRVRAVPVDGHGVDVVAAEAGVPAGASGVDGDIVVVIAGMYSAALVRGPQLA